MKSSAKRHLEKQTLKLQRGQISRRQFVRSAVTAGVVLPTALSLADQAIANTPSMGGHFKAGLGHGSTTDSLDPATYENGFMTMTSFSLYNHMTEVGPDGQLRPELVESYEATPDAKNWIFKVRSGVEFHNGKTLDAEDIVASLNYHRGPDSKSAAKGNLAGVEVLRADGDNVIAELNEGNADFPVLLSDYHFTIRPSSEGKIDPTSPIGTGPYSYVNFDPGVRLEGARNPNYFKPDTAFFDSIEILSIIDVTARQNAALNDEVDAIDRVDPKTVALLSRAPHLAILETTGTLHYTFPMRVDTAPFDNLHLRTALKLAVKRQELVDKILFGHGALGNDHPISTANQFHASNIPQREFDPDMARHHYQQSGHSGPIQLSASDAAFAGAVDAAQLIAASAAECGIEIEVIREPSDGYWSNVWNKKPWCACYWGGRPTEDWMFSSAYIAETEWNDTAWRDTEGAIKFNQIVVQARSELDSDKRRALYEEAQLLIRDDGGALVPMFANHIHALNRRIGHSDDVAANWQMDGSKATERWWFV